MVLDFAKSTFMWLLPISMVLSIFFYWQERKPDSATTQTEETSKLESVISVIKLLLTLAIFIGGIVLVLFKYKTMAWIIMLFTIPAYLSRAAGTYASIGIIGRVVQFEKTEKLSVRECWAIETVAYTLYLLDMYKLPAMLLEIVARYENTVISDCIYLVIYLLLLFLYVFLSCALLPVPLACISKLMIKVNRLIKNKTKLFMVGEYFIDQIDKPAMKRPLLIKILEAEPCKKKALRIVTWFVSPIIIVVDAIFALVGVLWSLLITSFGYLFLLLRMMKRTIGKITVWINNLSDRRLVATSFRVALIATLAITVITNRYTPLLRTYESSTGVLEFVASAILIPVIFEWISSTKNKVKQT